MYISRIVELTTLTPLYIKGKEMDFGEGMLRGEDGNVYLIDNDKLCDYIDRKNKVDEYVKYFVRDEDEGYNDIEGFAAFLNVPVNVRDFVMSPDTRGAGITIRKNGNTYRIDVRRFKDFMRRQVPSLVFSFRRDDYDLYKDMSLQYFLTRYNIFPSPEELKRMAKGQIQLGETGSVQSFIQSLDNRHFIPGSSVKGAIRNAVLWKIMSEPGKKQWLQDFVDNKLTQLANGNLYKIRRRRARTRDLLEKFSSQFGDEHDRTLDDQSFTIGREAVQGKYPHRWLRANDTLRDVFRIVKVSDANFTEKGFDRETVRAVCVSGSQTYQKGFDIHLECVQVQSRARFKITIDMDFAETFFGKDNIPFYFQSVEALLATADEFFQTVWSEETAFFNNKKPIRNDDRSKRQFKAGTQQVETFYTQMPKPDGKYLFRTGWGGGFLSKTQFLNLEPEQRKAIRDLKTQRNDPAPKSRALIVENDEAVMPLGWCHLRIAEDAELPAVDEARSKFVKHTPGTSVSSSKTESVSASVFKEALADLHRDPSSRPIAVSKYKKGDVIRNAPIFKEGERYKIAIKGQEQQALLIGKPPMYARVMNVTVVNINDGIVTEVQKK